MIDISSWQMAACFQALWQRFRNVCFRMSRHILDPDINDSDWDLTDPVTWYGKTSSSKYRGTFSLIALQASVHQDLVLRPIYDRIQRVKAGCFVCSFLSTTYWVRSVQSRRIYCTRTPEQGAIVLSFPLKYVWLTNLRLIRSKPSLCRSWSRWSNYFKTRAVRNSESFYHLNPAVPNSQ